MTNERAPSNNRPAPSLRARKIAIVPVHTGNAATSERRLLVMAAMLRQRGLQCDVLRPSHRAREDHPASADAAEVKFFAVDNPDQPKNDQHTCTSLVEHLRAGGYTTVMLKGLGYAVGKQIMEAELGVSEFVGILGGSWRDKNLHRFGFFFTEHAGQECILAERRGHSAVVHRLPKYLPLDDWRPLRQQPKEFDVAYIANFIARKNHMAMAPLFGSEHSIVFIGDGPLREQVREVAKGHANVVFAGQKPWRETVKLAASARVLAHPSTFEGLPRAVVEAMACGVPVVGLASTLGAALGDEPACLLVPPESFCEETERLLADRARLEAMSRAAVDYYERNHNHRVLEEAVDAFYSWVLRKG